MLLRGICINRKDWVWFTSDWTNQIVWFFIQCKKKPRWKQMLQYSSQIFYHRQRCNIYFAQSSRMECAHVAV